MSPKQLTFFRRTAVSLLLAIMAMIILINSRLFDPQPIGNLQWQKTFRQTIPSQSKEIAWLGNVPQGDFTVRVTAVLQSGEPDSQFGLIIGQEDDYLAVTVSPSGYAAVWRELSLHSSPLTLYPFSPWSHVQPGNEPNEIWVDSGNGRVTIRINREILWQGEEVLMDEVGVIGESWGETAVIHFTAVQLFTP